MVIITITCKKIQTCRCQDLDRSLAIVMMSQTNLKYYHDAFEAKKELLIRHPLTLILETMQYSVKTSTTASLSIIVNVNCNNQNVNIASSNNCNDSNAQLETSTKHDAAATVMTVIANHNVKYDDICRLLRPLSFQPFPYCQNM